MQNFFFINQFINNLIVQQTNLTFTYQNSLNNLNLYNFLFFFNQWKQKLNINIFTNFFFSQNTIFRKQYFFLNLSKNMKYLNTINTRVYNFNNTNSGNKNLLIIYNFYIYQNCKTSFFFNIFYHYSMFNFYILFCNPNLLLKKNLIIFYNFKTKHQSVLNLNVKFL